MALSLVLPTYNRPDDIKRLFESILLQVELPAEIIVVIGPGDTESNLLVQTYTDRLSGIRIFQASKPSLVHSLNIGIAAATQEIVALIDDDVWLPENWVKNIVEKFRNDKSLGAYGGRDRLQINVAELQSPEPAKKVGVFTWSGNLIGNHHKGSIKSPVYVDVLKGCNLSFRRSFLTPLQIEPALEGRGAEVCTEIDICQRIQAKGFRILYDNDNYVLHYISQRAGYDSRSDLFSPVAAARIYNQSLVISKFRPYHEILFSFLRSFFIGTKMEPGLLRLVLLFPRYKWRTIDLTRKNSRARIRGILKGFKLRLR